MDSRQEIYRLLRDHRADLVRHNRHKVYRLPNGALFVMGETRTDYRGWRNGLAQLRRLLGVTPALKRLTPRKQKLKAKKKQLSHGRSLHSLATFRSLTSELNRVFPKLGDPAATR
jgi:hypothetical protein